jgi:hypothetical protein
LRRTCPYAQCTQAKKLIKPTNPKAVGSKDGTNRASLSTEDSEAGVKSIEDSLKAVLKGINPAKLTVEGANDGATVIIDIRVTGYDAAPAGATA